MAGRSDGGGGVGAGDLLGGVVAGPDERPGLHVLEPHLDADAAQGHELGRGVVLDERQVLSCLERLHVLAKENYKSWADYYVAYMKSRTLFFEQTESDYIDYVITLRKMYKNPEFPCLKYPL